MKNIKNGKSETVSVTDTGGFSVSYPQLDAHLQISFSVCLFAYFIFPSD